MKRTYTKQQADQLGNHLVWLVNGGYISSSLQQSLVAMMKDDRVKCVEFDHFNPDESEWDGTIYIDFARATIKAFDVVNGLLGSHNPDEIHFVTAKRLRMWWD